MEAALDLWCRSSFDFDSPEFSAGKREKKVHLGSVGGSIVVRLGAVRRDSDQSLKDKALPGLANDRVTEQSFLIPNARQRVCDTAVAHIYLGRLDQPLADIPMPGRQTPNQQRVSSKIKITGDCFAIDGQTARQIGGIRNLNLVVRQHRPESPQRLSRYAGPELPDVALQTGANKIAPPEQADVIRFGQKLL